jgi:hypothetical protein
MSVRNVASLYLGAASARPLYGEISGGAGARRRRGRATWARARGGDVGARRRAAAAGAAAGGARAERGAPSPRDYCRVMHETPYEIERLRELLDRSAADAGPHLRDIVTEDRRLTAEQICERLTGMRLLVVATVTADGRPLTGAVDGYFMHGSWYFSSGRNSVRVRHLTTRPAVSATYLPGEELAITVHGRAELFDLHHDDGAGLRRAMLDHYLPLQGPAFGEWLNQIDAVGARIHADKMFTFGQSE